MLDEIEKTIVKLRQTKPLILCLTNHVTMDFMANSLLSLGAAPIMTEDARELEELVQICHAVNLNIGTLDKEFIERAHTVARLTQQYKKPLILDPVGAGATHIRTTSSQALMTTADIIRGNASEIMALTSNINKTLGVEATHQVSDAVHSATMLAREHRCTVVVSGEVDFLTNGQKESRLSFGSSLMPLVTGMGCTLTAVIAAFRAVLSDAYNAAYLATAYYSLCASVAAQKTNKPGTFRTFFIDELYTANVVAMRKFTDAI